MCVEKQTVASLTQEKKMDVEIISTSSCSSRFKSVCVYCGSSTGKRDSYRDAAIQLGQELVYSFHFSLF